MRLECIRIPTIRHALSQVLSLWERYIDSNQPMSRMPVSKRDVAFRYSSLLSSTVRGCGCGHGLGGRRGDPARQASGALLASGDLGRQVSAGPDRPASGGPGLRETAGGSRPGSHLGGRLGPVACVCMCVEWGAK